jgi:hypothetical protein
MGRTSKRCRPASPDSEAEEGSCSADEETSPKRRKRAAKPESGKLCCAGLCKCREPVGLQGACLSQKMPKREKQLKAIFGPRSQWPARLLLPGGKGPKGEVLGDVRVAWHHFKSTEIAVSVTEGGQGDRGAWAAEAAQPNACVCAWQCGAARRAPRPFHRCRWRRSQTRRSGGSVHPSPSAARLLPAAARQRAVRGRRALRRVLGRRRQPPRARQASSSAPRPRPFLAGLRSSGSTTGSV